MFDDMESESEAFAKELPRSCTSRSRDREGARKVSTVRSRRNHETEEEAALRRFHDAQRMARFRARKRKQQQLLQTNRQDGHGQTGSETPEHPDNSEAEGKYSQLLAIIEALGRDVKLSYAGSRSSAERLKSGIVRARTLIRECLVETRLNLRQ